MEDPVHMVERTWHSLVLHRGSDRLAADDAPKAEIGHQALDGAARDRDALPVHLPPDLACAVDLEVLGEDALDLRLQHQVPLRPCRKPRRIGPLGDLVVVCTENSNRLTHG